MKFEALIEQNKLHENFRQCFTIGDLKLLLIHQHGQAYLIENKCGHFGISLEDAKLENENIICRGHNISFSLKDGHIVNRPYENCDPIKIFKIVIRDGWIGLEI